MQANPSVDHKDTYVRRIYSSYGIDVLVEIDYVKRHMSFIEPDGRAKNWKFALRGPEYFNGWKSILAAMSYAVHAVQKEFEELDGIEIEELAKRMVQIGKQPLKDKPGSE